MRISHIVVRLYTSSAKALHGRHGGLDQRSSASCVHPCTHVSGKAGRGLV